MRHRRRRQDRVGGAEGSAEARVGSERVGLGWVGLGQQTIGIDIGIRIGEAAARSRIRAEARVGSGWQTVSDDVRAGLVKSRPDRDRRRDRDRSQDRGQGPGPGSGPGAGVRADIEIGAEGRIHKTSASALYWHCREPAHRRRERLTWEAPSLTPQFFVSVPLITSSPEASHLGHQPEERQFLRLRPLQLMDPAQGNIAAQSFLFSTIQICIALTFNGLFVLTAAPSLPFSPSASPAFTSNAA